MTAGSGTGRARLGIVLLDGPAYEADFGCFEPTSQAGLVPSQLGFFGQPGSWPVPTAYAVAHDATAEATLAASDRAAAGLAAAIDRLAPVADLVTSDCGFFWGVSGRAGARSAVPLLLSGIDLIDLAAEVTERPIGVLSYSKADAEEMLHEHALRRRLRIVGFSDQPAWQALAPEQCDKPGWSPAQLDRDSLGREVGAVIESELDGGELDGVGALVIECTVLPQFRRVLRRLTCVPIFDVASTCLALLEAPGGGIHQFDADRRVKVASG